MYLSIFSQISETPKEGADTTTTNSRIEMSLIPIDLESEYKKDKDLRKEDVETLQEWVSKQPHLPELSDYKIMLFLHSCYCMLEPTKRAIDSYYTLKARLPDFFANKNPNLPALRTAIECQLFTKLPKKSPDGDTIFFYTLIENDPHKFVYTDFVKLGDMNINLCFEEGLMDGLLIVLDMAKFSYGHLSRLGITALKDNVTYLQEALPVRLKGLHLVNAGAVIDKLMHLIKPFLKKELSSKIYLHKDLSASLFKYVPQDCLPRDFGGKATYVKALHDSMRERLIENTQFFLQDEKKVVNEARRMSRRRSSVTYDVEIDGSFRKLAME